MDGGHTWLQRTAVAAGIGVASTALVTLASRRWQRATDHLLERLEASSPDSGPTFSIAELATLPAPVQRYFHRVLRDGQPRVRAARIRQTGTFRSRTGGDPAAGWSPFTARQWLTAAPPGFLWDASIHLAPVVSVRVRDGYVAGEASMRGAVASVVSVADAADDRRLRVAALERWLAEAVWLPTALLPGGGVGWAPIDDSHARASVNDGSITTSLEFEFASGGEVVAVRTPARLRALPGKHGGFVPTPWGGRYTAYEQQSGMLVPVQTEVYWVIDDREMPYYRGRNERLEYDFAASA